MEYTVEEARQIIKETTEKNLPYVFKGIFPIVPTWDQFINHLDYQSTKEPPYVSEPDKGYEAIYGIFKKHNFYLQVRDAVCTPLRAKQFFPEGVAVKRFLIPYTVNQVVAQQHLLTLHPQNQIHHRTKMTGITCIGNV